MRKLKIFGSDGCSPCETLRGMIESGEIGIEGIEPGEKLDVEYHDVGTDEAFHFVADLGLEQLPTILLDDHPCRVVLRDAEHREIDPSRADEEGVYAIISCSLADPSGSEPPPAKAA